MARYIPGLNGPLKGSIGNNTYSKNRYGFYVKVKPIPTNPNTPAQATVRAYLTQAVANWQKVLTTAQRESWQHAASLHKKSAWGYGFTMSGYNLYIAHYIAMEKCDEAPILAPTIFLGAPPILEPTIAIDAGGIAEITAWPETEANYVLIIRQCSTTSLGVNYRSGAFKIYTYMAAGYVGNFDLGQDYPGSGEDYRLHLGYRVMDKRGAYSNLLETSLVGQVV